MEDDALIGAHGVHQLIRKSFLANVNPMFSLKLSSMVDAHYDTIITAWTPAPHGRPGDSDTSGFV